ncbi:MAG: hypothetical protein QOD07_96 [Frankiaceae bacterium]|jgi:hypothetical protein|nr:hypothetical protein [Frankiaceae bacterium]
MAVAAGAFAGHGLHLVSGLAFVVVAVVVGAVADRHDAKTKAQANTKQRVRRARPWVDEALAYGCVAAAVGAAGVHLAVMPVHFDEAFVYGLFFLVLAALQIGWAGALALRPSRRLLAAGLAANVAVIGLWLFTRLVAVPLGPGRGTREDFTALDLLATSFEVALVASAAALLVRRATLPRRSARALLHAQPLMASLVAVAAVVVATAGTAPPS